MTIQLNAKMIQGEHCLLYQLINESELNHFHVSMISTQPNLPAIAIACHIFEGESALLFMPKEALSMKLWLSDTTNTGSHLIQLIEDVVESLLTLGDHHLNLSNIYLDSDYCFIHPYTQKPLFLYMPLRYEVFDNKSAMKKMLFEWIQSCQQPLNAHQQHYMLQLMLFLSKEHMTFKSLLVGLKELKTHIASPPSNKHEGINDLKTESQDASTKEEKRGLTSKGETKEVVIKPYQAFSEVKTWLKGFFSKKEEPLHLAKAEAEGHQTNNKFKFSTTSEKELPVTREWDYADAQGVLKNVSVEQTSFETVLLSKKSGVTEPKVLLRHSGNTEVFFMKNNKLSIGRNPAINDIVIEDPVIGRIHAELHVHHEKFYVKDLNSLNGTWLNQTKIMANQFVEVKVGESIKVGKGELILL